MANVTGDSPKFKSKRISEPLSTEDWKSVLAADTRGGFMVFRDMYRSRAFLELSKNPKYALVLLEALSQLNMPKKTKRERELASEVRFKKRSRYVDTIIYLTQNRLGACGVGATTLSAAKKKLVELGFLDTVEPGELYRASTFRYSDRWRKYPNVPPQEDGKAVSRRVYANYSLSNPDHPIHRKRRDGGQNGIQELNASSIQKLNAQKSDPIQQLNASKTRSGSKPHSRTECIFKVSHPVQPVASSMPARGGSPSTEADPGDGDEGAGVWAVPPEGEKNQLESKAAGRPKTEPTEIPAPRKISPDEDRLVKLAETCQRCGAGRINGRQNRFPKEVELTFESGFRLFVHPTTVAIDGVEMPDERLESYFASRRREALQ